MNALQGPADEIDRIGTEIFRHWASRDLMTASLMGCITEAIGSPLQGDSDVTTSLAQGWSTRLNAISPNALDLSAELTRRYLRFEVDKLLQASELHRFDLQITPYRIGFTLAVVHQHLKSMPLERERRMELARQYRRFLADTLTNLREQASLGIVVPQGAIPSCLAGIKGLAG